jgi:hypoxanthine phosphoribosyltransferase
VGERDDGRPSAPEPAAIARVRAGAEEIHTPAAVSAALDRMAEAVGRTLGDSCPIVLAVMTGGAVPAVRLMRRFDFLHEFDYVHATRYAGTTRGGDIEWLARPRLSLRGRAVLIVDDILDEGHTLKAIQDLCRDSGASALHVAVLTRKLHDRCVPGVTADFVGLEVPDRYVFGVGMDYHEYLRQLDGIYALADSDEPG